jgi:hypothetical protein
VYASSCARRHASKINHKVANLPVEIVLVGVPILAKIIIGVGINDRNALERRSSLEGGDIDRVTDKLGVVVLDNRRTDEVGACWEID